MEIVFIALIAVISIVVVIILTTIYCIYKHHCKERAHKYRYQYSPLPQVDIELESQCHANSDHSTISYSHSTDHEPIVSDTELGQLSSSLSSLSEDQQSYRDHNEIAEVQNLHISHNIIQNAQSVNKEQAKTLPVINMPQELRQGLTLSESFRTYIINNLIPSFMDQRAGNQFAVVLLLSETDYQNINEVKLSPSDINGRPKIDNSLRSLPQSTQLYCNYIVARPTIPEAIHSEQEIFAIGSTDHSNNSRFNELWDAYCRQHNWIPPEYILIYSWNLPCKNCTDLIIRSLLRSPYNRATVIVVYTCEWKEEDIPQRQHSRERMLSQGIVVEKVPYHTFVRKLFAP